MGGSGLIPGWKVKRELLRFRQQIAWYWELSQAGRRTRQHDLDRPRLVRREDGPQPSRPKIAAFLIFQPGEMPGSILESCDQLAEMGYSVLVVSNGPLTAKARASLLPHVWRLLERPNLGYDFGGYREAVMHLWDQSLEPEELLILNDSVWVIHDAFPPFMDRLKQLGADVTGAVLRSKKHRRWLESYFFCLNRTALASSSFQAFWQGYRLVDSKFGVIRQGERDFTVALASGGLSVAALGDNADFLHRMAEATDAELRLALDYAAFASDDLAQVRVQLLSELGGPDWRARVLTHIAASLGGKRVWNAQFPIPALRVMGFPFVKKSREPVNAAWRTQFMRGVEDKVVPSPTPAVRVEMSARQKEAVTAVVHWAPRDTAG